MVKDENLAKFVNLTKSTNLDTPFDLYQIMATKVAETIFNLPVKNKANLLTLSINRKFVKTAIMTIPYGVTIIGIADQLKAQFFTEMFVEKNTNLNNFNDSPCPLSNFYNK